MAWGFLLLLSTVVLATSVFFTGSAAGRIRTECSRAEASVALGSAGLCIVFIGLLGTKLLLRVAGWFLLLFNGK